MTSSFPTLAPKAANAFSSPLCTPGSIRATSLPPFPAQSWTSFASPSLRAATGPAMTSVCMSLGISLLAASSISSTWKPSLLSPSTHSFMPRSLASAMACSPWPLEK